MKDIYTRLKSSLQYGNKTKSPTDFLIITLVYQKWDD